MSRTTHHEREAAVLADVEANFPNFTGRPLAWEPVPEGQDPPDFISRLAELPEEAISLAPL